MRSANDRSFAPLPMSSRRKQGTRRPFSRHSAKWVLKQKPTKKRARLTTKGCGQIEGSDYFDTFAPVARLAVTRIIFALAVKIRARLYTADIAVAFPNATLEEEIYMKIPDEVRQHLQIVPTFTAIRLGRALYGLKQASREWYKTIATYLQENGYTRLQADSCAFLKDTTLFTPGEKLEFLAEIKEILGEDGYFLQSSDQLIWVIVYVDDLLIMTKDANAYKTIQQILTKQFKITTDVLSQFLGIEVNYTLDAGILIAHQQNYTRKCIADIEAMVGPILATQTPLPVRVQISSALETDDLCDFTTFRRIVGMLNYLQCATRPDISYSVNQLQQQMHKPSMAHLELALHIVGYLKTSIHFGLRYQRDANPFLITYCDASNADCADTLRSTYGFLTILQGGPISWKSKRLPSVSPGGTTESEYKGMYFAAQETMYLRQLLSELGFRQHEPTLIRQDNTSAIKIAHGNVQDTKLKHMKIKYFAVREWIALR